MKAKEEYAYIQHKFSKVPFKFPSKYADQSDLILDVLGFFYNRNYIDIAKFALRAELGLNPKDLYYILSPTWVISGVQFSCHKFFLLDRGMVFDYFIKNWKKDSSSFNTHYTKHIEENYDDLCKLAITERDEEIILEII